MKANLKLVLFILVAINGNIAAQNWTLKTKEQLLDENYHFSSFRISYNDVTKLAINAKEYCFKANEYRDKKDYTNSLKNYEISLSIYPWGACYYQYGVCLMDTGDYENAGKAFRKAIYEIKYDDPYTMIAPYYHESGRNTIYSFDNNGIVRELYFSYYNLACIYSLNNKLSDCINHIKLALEYGYPYLNHIFTGPDLKNLFSAPNSAQIKEEINRIYSAGTINTVSGKTYRDRPGPNDLVDYEFIDGSQIKTYLRTSEDRDHVMYGTYVIRNYHVIIRYNRVTGREGHNYMPGGGVIGVYEYYTPYDRTINETEYISLKKMEGEWAWEEQ